jgi:hypothetical protein
MNPWDKKAIHGLPVFPKSMLTLYKVTIITVFKTELAEFF